MGDLALSGMASGVSQNLGGAINQEVLRLRDENHARLQRENIDYRAEVQEGLLSRREDREAAKQQGRFKDFYTNENGFNQDGEGNYAGQVDTHTGQRQFHSGSGRGGGKPTAKVQLIEYYKSVGYSQEDAIREANGGDEKFIKNYLINAKKNVDGITDQRTTEEIVEEAKLALAQIQGRNLQFANAEETGLLNKKDEDEEGFWSKTGDYLNRRVIGREPSRGSKWKPAPPILKNVPTDQFNPDDYLQDYLK